MRLRSSRAAALRLHGGSPRAQRILRLTQRRRSTSSAAALGARRHEPRLSEPPVGIGSMVFPPQVVNRDELALESDGALGGEGDIKERIRLLEARLDNMLEQVPANARETSDGAPCGHHPIEVRGASPGPLDGIRSSAYYRLRWGRSGLVQPGHEFDEFGLDPEWEARVVQPLANFLYSRWFRVEVAGIEHVPSAGRCLVVANHSGVLPLDGPMLRVALRRDHPAARELRWLAEDFLYDIPFAGTLITRAGAVRACRENAERLLAEEHVVAAFPEGIRGLSKLYKERYRLQRFGRGGFIRICLRTRTPLVPCAVVGAEETAVMLRREEVLARLLGLPYLPLTPTFPWLGPLGLLPAPTKWRLVFGPPADFREYGAADADDDVLVARLAEQVRATIQRMVDAAVRERHSIWRG